jgi:hypothetical protein
MDIRGIGFQGIYGFCRRKGCDQFHGGYAPMVRRLLLLGCLLPFMAGCLHLAHKPIVDTDCWRASDEIPQVSKDCVYVFMFNDHDPMHMGDLDLTRDYIQDLGFGKTFYGYPLHVGFFADKMRLIHANCPQARFAIIGFQGGAAAAQKLAGEAAISDIPIDFMLYLSPKSVASQDEYVLSERTITIWGEVACGNKYDCGEGEKIFLEGAHSMMLPTNPEVLNILERELTLIGFGVPMPSRHDRPTEPLVKPIPAPRKTAARPKPLAPEWQFLRPFGTPVTLATLPSTPQPSESLPPPREVSPK